MITDNTDHALGDNIGRYRLIGEIARGGMGIVYIAATHGPAGFSKLVALKELRPDLVEDGDFLTMFLEEARMAARLNHPNIVQTNDVSEADGRHFIAMEYLEGRSFYQVLKRLAGRGGFPQRMAIAVLRDALAALDYAHELAGFDGRPLGFVHRDVSPHNIFLTFEGHTKVIDFGIAKARDSSLETKTGVLKGRANYMAPEQLTRRTDRRSDLFSMGALMFEVLSGRRLWQGLGDVEILGALTRGEIPSLNAVRPSTPEALLRICHKALQPRVEDRFATAGEMRDELDHYLWSTGGAPRVREVSALLTQEFDLERQRTRAHIEAALERLHSGEGGRLESLTPLDPPGATTHTHGSLSRARRLLAEGGRRDPTGMQMLSGVMPMPTRSTPMPTGVGAAMLAALPADASRAMEETPLFMRPSTIAGTVLALVFMLTTAIVAFQRTPSPVIEPVAPAPAAPAPSARVDLPAPAAVMPQSDSIVLSVTVTPSTAQLTIDGEPMPSNPFLGHFAKGPGTHRIRAVAPGYQPKERLVSFDDNVMIDLSLTARAPVPSVSRREPSREAHRTEPWSRPATTAAAPPASAPPPVAPPTHAERPSDITPRADWEAPRRRSIDTNNPY